ncbi:MAG: nucleotidyl transferase AbiEii/AbiGii toxin family protein [Minisyncoccales bacterium]
MISQETIQKLATKYQTSEFPNIIREYFQHLFLYQLYVIENAGNLLFKGGTALRIIYGSPRFSEDLDFSIFGIEPRRQRDFIEDVFTAVLAKIEKIGIKVELGPKPGSTAEGYYGDAEFQIYEYPFVGVSINISSRNGREIKGEVDSIANEFVSTYTIFHLSQTEIINEKVFGALLQRKKARDFYDLYFIMRKGLLSNEQKKKLNDIKDKIILKTEEVDFKTELGVLLPQDQQAIIKNFKTVLLSELKRQTAF